MRYIRVMLLSAKLLHLCYITLVGVYWLLYFVYLFNGTINSTLIVNYRFACHIFECLEILNLFRLSIVYYDYSIYYDIYYVHHFSSCFFPFYLSYQIRLISDCHYYNYYYYCFIQIATEIICI